MQLFKLLTSLSLLSFTIGLWGARNMNQLFPVFPLAVLMSSLFIFAIIISLERRIDEEIFYFVLILVCFIAVSIRLFIFTFPVSMIAFDPDTFAISIQLLIQKGYTTGIISSYYQEVPLFHIYIAVYTEIAGIRVANAMGIWPIIVGILFTISAAIFSLYLKFELRASLIAGLIMAVLANSVTFSYTPIPNLHAAALFLGIIISTYKLYYGDVRYLVLTNVLFISLIYTHKLHPLIISLSVIGIILIPIFKSAVGSTTSLINFDVRSEVLLLSVGMSIAWSVIVLEAVQNLLFPGVIVVIASLAQINQINELPTTTLDKQPLIVNLQDKSQIFNLFLLFASLLTVQWVLLTNLLYSIIVRRALPLVRERQSIPESSYFNPSHAEIASPGIFNIFFHHSDILIVFLLTMIAWVYFYYMAQTADSHALLGITGTCLLFIPTSLFSGEAGGLGAPRAMLIFSPLAVAFLAAFIFQNPNSFAKLAIVIVLIMQVFSAGFVPDYPNSYRKYLTNEEVDAKEFGLEYSQRTVHTDLFFAVESTLPVTDRGKQIDGKYNPYSDNKFAAFGRDLLDKNISSKEYQTIALRTEITTIRTVVPPGWELTWKPEQSLNTNSNYSRTYDGGTVTYYTRQKQRA